MECLHFILIYFEFFVKFYFDPIKFCYIKFLDIIKIMLTFILSCGVLQTLHCTENNNLATTPIIQFKWSNFEHKFCSIRVLYHLIGWLPWQWPIYYNLSIQHWYKVTCFYNAVYTQLGVSVFDSILLSLSVLSFNVPCILHTCKCSLRTTFLKSFLQ